MFELDLKGKTALVTGGGKGIGLAIAQGLASAGCAIAVSGRDEERLQEAVGELSEMGVKAVALAADMRDAATALDLPNRAAAALGRLDFLVNNAGMANPMPALEISVEVWDQILDTNLRGTFLCAQSAARIMKEGRGGVITNIGSVQSSVAARNQAAYGASKGGMLMLTKVLALEWAQYGIRVNMIAPGSITTDINRDYLADPDNLNRNLYKIALNRIGSPEDVAGLAVFLCTEHAGYITGTPLYVDGGWTIE